MAKDTKSRKERDTPTRKQPRLSDKTIERAKSDILHGVGYKRPPEHTRFKKGQSGNPKGRPRSCDLGSGADSSANALVLKEAERLVAVREGEEVTQIRRIEAVLRTQYASAMKGNAYAQKYIMERYDRAERARKQEIAERNTIWEHYVDICRREIAEAKRKGEAPPNHLPHPDDIIIDPVRGVRFIGPFDEEQVTKLEKTCRVRDILLMQDALDQRSTRELDSDDPLDGPGSAFLFALVFNDTVPDRFKLDDNEIIMRTMRYAAMPKRRLLKELYRGWRSLGASFPRGKVFPPLRVGKRWIDFFADLLQGLRDHCIDIATCTLEDLEAVVTDVVLKQQEQSV